MDAAPRRRSRNFSLPGVTATIFMTPERYQQIGDLYHAALEVDARERAAFLERACAGDEEMRREVESLIN